jgi:hypothetical protein
LLVVPFLGFLVCCYCLLAMVAGFCCGCVSFQGSASTPIAAINGGSEFFLCSRSRLYGVVVPCLLV